MDDETTEDVVDPTNLEPEAPEASPDTQPEPEVHEPPPDHPRFNEIYGKMKEFERQLSDKDQTIEAMVDHNKSLQESMDGLYDKVSVSERPDAITDPEGHDKWLSDKIKRDIKREQPAPEPKPKVVVSRVAEQAETLKGVFPDFDSVANFGNELLTNDPYAKLEIMDSKNPPRALYEYGLKKKGELSKKRADNIKQASVEGGGTPPTEGGTTTLTSMQERARKGLGISKEDYIKQLDFSTKRGY